MKEKVKILHIIKSLGRGGAEMLLPETLRLHNQDEFEFHYIYFLPWKDAMVEAIKARGGLVTCIPAKNNIEVILKAWDVIRYIKENNIILVHAHLPWAGIVSRIVGKRTGIPIIYTEHNKQERYHWATRFVNLASMNWLTKIIAVSEDVEVSIRKHKPSLRRPLQKILNGVNTERFAPGLFSGKTVRESFKIPESAPVIGTIAVFRFQKRLDLWIEIAKKISGRKPEVHFILVGDGPQRALLEEKRLAHGMVDRIHFTGVQSEVRPYLAAFDAYMMSSVFEGLPIALLEAMASGCPAIATDAGGIKEMIRHDEDGLICSVDDPYKLVDFAIEILENGKKRTALGNAGRKRVVENFSMVRMVTELERVYRQVALKQTGSH